MSIDFALKLTELRKQYAATVALEQVSLRVRPGEVHALLGENGAGKSTLVRMLSGLTQPDSGTIHVFGEAVTIADPRVSHRLGIRTAFQEISLVKDLTVAQNFLLMEEPTGPLGLIRRRRMYDEVAAALAQLGLRNVDPGVRIRDLDLPARQKIEIARAVSRKPRIILLDEPTAALLSNDVEWLGGLIEQMKSAGTTIIFISHRMQEVRDFCESLTILRNGRNVASAKVDDISDDEVFELMIGRSVAAAFPPRPALPAVPEAAEDIALSVRGLATPAVRTVSFDLGRGRILGLGGLHGMGQRELFLALFGAAEITAGEIKVNGTPVELRSPADAIRAEIGISLVPEDRKTEGLFLELDGSRNVSLPSQRRFERAGLIDVAAENAAVRDVFRLLQVPLRALWLPVKQLSGGNQQKIVIAKWLLARSKILLLYDPTRGVDVGTKAEIYRLAREFVTAGGSILFYSTDISELVNLCDDVLVIYRGTIAASLHGDEISDARIMRAAVGHAGRGRADEVTDGIRTSH
jgi:ribose transport system ATP-binding protein